jgi:mono/diheme cytochrome c family protein
VNAPALPRYSTRQVLPLALAGLLLLAAAGWTAARISSDRASLFADANDAAMTTRGAHTYWRQCRGCHGSYLQGQPFWQLVDANYGRRAPALDETGRAWRRSDEDLFHIIKFGRYAERPQTLGSQMPAFQGWLDDQDTLAVLAYVKASWPLGLRSLQAQRNPRQMGMPADAQSADWRLPATCFPHHVKAEAQ